MKKITNGAGFIFEKYNKPCENCHTVDNLTLHHEKDIHERKTGKTKILCRDCHNAIEDEYRREGRIKSNIIPITHNEQLKLDYMSGLLPFYSIQPKSPPNLSNITDEM